MGMLDIDSELRTISIPEQDIVAGVEHDKDVNKVTFRCQRYYDGNDLSTFDIRVVTRNAAGDMDATDCSDIDADGETLRFSWTIGRVALAYAGRLEFVVCMRQLEGSTIVREYNTATHYLRVLPGIEATRADITDESDLVEQIKAIYA